MYRVEKCQVEQIRRAVSSLLDSIFLFLIVLRHLLSLIRICRHPGLLFSLLVLSILPPKSSRWDKKMKCKVGLIKASGKDIKHTPRWPNLTLCFTLLLRHYCYFRHLPAGPVYLLAVVIYALWMHLLAMFFGPMSSAGVCARISDVYVRKWTPQGLSLSRTGSFQAKRTIALLKCS